MAHLSDGTLRRLYDEPVAVAATARDHFNGCSSCQDRFAAIAETARDVQSALAVPAAAVDTGAAYRATMDRVQPRRVAWLPRLSLSHPRRLSVALLAAALAVGVVVTAMAANLITIFEPTQVQVVTISQGSFAGFPDLSNWGTVKVTSQPELQQVDSASAAAKATGLKVIAPTLPKGVTVPAPQYATVSQLDGTFTFDKQKADAAAAQAGSKAKPLPANLDGSTLTVVGGPGEVAVYGSIDPSQLKGGNLPPLVIGEAKAPVVTSTKASVQDIKNGLLQAGVSPDLVNSIADPTHTLPIPVPNGMTTSQTTLSDGTKATFVGDNSKIYAAMIFIKKGVVYVVAGSYDESTLAAIANTL